MENEVHVWQIALDTLPPGRERILSASECDRMARFHFERDRGRYAASHAALRQILARYAGGEPAALEFTAGPGGKPALEPKMNPWGFRSIYLIPGISRWSRWPGDATLASTSSEFAATLRRWKSRGAFSILRKRRSLRRSRPMRLMARSSHCGLARKRC